MSTTIKCSFCNQSFEFDNSSGSLLATCPHCSKQNSVAVHSSTTQRLHILRNAPSLVGGKPCPECAALIEPDAVICVHCGYNVATGKIQPSLRVSSARKRRILIGVGLLLLLGVIVLYLSRPEPTGDSREVFEAKKAQAAKVFRQKLYENAPLYMPNDKVELRRDNGQIVRGTLLRFAGTRTNRMVIIATEVGEEIIPINSVNRDARVRMDTEYREKYIRYMLNIRPAETPVYQQSEK